MVVISGFSEERSCYCETSSYLRLYGWVLGTDISTVLIYSEDKLICNIQINILREDIWITYNKVGSPICGWKYESYIDTTINTKDLWIYYCTDAKKEVLFTQKIKVYENPEKENYLKSFKIIAEDKVIFNETSIYSKLYNICKDNMNDYIFDEEEYMQWYNKVNYAINYPDYCNEFSGNNLHTKALQHFISIKLLKFDSDDIYLDVASSQSVCPDIVRRYYTKNIYRQDIRYKIGVNGEFIGSNAESIPLNDSSIDKISLHCSLEHFENNSDINFIKEAHRILKKGGKLVITPLYLNDTAHILTSPSIWEKKYQLKDLPVFTHDYPLVLREEILQRQEKVFSPETLANEILYPFQDLFHFEIIYIKGVHHKELINYPKFTLLATKKF